MKSQSYEIRQLIENYYDIQKIRVETFNRIVCWVKENKDELMKILSHIGSETHRRDTSQFKDEAQYKSASHNEYETHFNVAFKLLENKKYSEFVKRFVLSQEFDETQDGGASQKKYETQNSFAFSQKLKEIEDMIWFHNKLYETEKELYHRLDAWSKEHPIRLNFLNQVKGIGPIFSSGLIAWLSEPIKKANYVSQIWSYCGLAPNQVRKKGQKVNYNPRLKTFMWKIGQSFIKFKCFGRELYLKFKEDCQRKHPDWTKLHIHNYVRRKVVKLFLASLWEVWRKMNNLPATKPYPIEVLGHKDLITPEMWIKEVEK